MTLFFGSGNINGIKLKLFNVFIPITCIINDKLEVYPVKFIYAHWIDVIISRIVSYSIIYTYYMLEKLIQRSLVHVVRKNHFQI